MKNNNPNKSPLRSRIKRWWKSYEWPVVIALGVLAFAMGYIGLRKHLPAVGTDNTVFDIAYRSLVLFVMDYGASAGY